MANDRGAIPGWGWGGLTGDPSTWPPILTRTYAGKPAAASAAMAADASSLQAQGYVPVNQQYVQGSWSGGAWLVALLLCILLIGILVFIYMLIVKPDGTLTVTYQRQPQRLAQPSSPAYQVFRVDARPPQPSSPG